MSTAIPGRHIEGMVKAFAHTDPAVPAGFTAETWRTYCEDADGGRAPYRAWVLNAHSAKPLRDALLPQLLDRDTGERGAEDWRVD